MPMSLEGRIARLELTLSLIFEMLPKFIREPLGKVVEANVKDMERDGKETIRLRRDEN